MMVKSKANSKTTHTGGGFSAIELLIVVTILSVVTGFGLMGIKTAKASIRLSGAAREYASYIERARVHAIRSHANNESERANVAINENQTSYNVNLDLDGDGVFDTRTIPLPDGVKFKTVETIAFDWRGRTWNTFAGFTRSNAQVSIVLENEIGTASVDVTGSGDVTIDSAVFDDELPEVSLNVTDLASGATSETTSPSTATPTPTPGASPTPDNGTTNPSPTPTPDAGGGTGNATPTPTPSSTPAATPNATPNPTPRATPSATPTPEVCTVTADPLLLIMHLNGSATVKISHTSSSSQTVSASSSKASNLQVSPATQSVSAGGSGTFTLKSKKSIGVYSVTFSTGCGSKTIPVTVIL